MSDVEPTREMIDVVVNAINAHYIEAGDLDMIVYVCFKAMAPLIRDAQRLEDAKLLKDRIMQERPGEPRIWLAIAANAIERGRFLTAPEQMDNLERELRDTADGGNEDAYLAAILAKLEVTQ